MKIDSSIYYQEAIDNLSESGRPLEREVADAIQKIKGIAEKNPDARWGRVALYSEKNMSWIIASNLKPIFERMFVVLGSTEITALNLLPEFNEKSKSAEMQKLFFSFQDVYRMYKSNSQEMNIFGELYGLFIMTHSDFEENIIRKTKTGDGPYCIYCYREIWHSGEHRLGGDTCHIHSDLNRSWGKYHLPEYEKLKKYFIMHYAKDDSIYQYQTNKLKQLNIPHWDTTKDRNKWFSVTMKKIDACAPNKVESLSQSFSNDKSDNPFEKDWPKEFSGTFLRYIAFDLATQRKPLKKVRDRLESIWEGNLPPEVAKKHNVSRQNLHQQLKKWTKVINDLRDMNLSDEVIKFIFDFKFLPNRK